MKKLVLVFVMVSMIFASKSFAQKADNSSNDSTEMIFNETDHNFGTLKYQADASFEFVFKNTGKAPLIIKNVQPTCGCTVASSEKDPVLPKGKGKVVVKYDTDRVGPFIKTIRVYSNAKNSPVELIIRGEVKPAEKS